MPDSTADTPPRRTALHELHIGLGARMVPFAGYEMPVSYDGVIAEHLHTRAAAGLFDVSHMGIVDLGGSDIAEQLETLVPASVTGIAPGRMRYTMLTNDTGGVIDDLIVTNTGDGLRVVVNASRTDVDLAHLATHLADAPVHRTDLALVALQGPAAAEVLGDHDPSVSELVFMQSATMTLGGRPVEVSRSGYTGEDGFELALPAEAATELAQLLLADDRVAPAGLGARDTLRLEAGLCLYGNDLDETTTPIEADLAWSIQKRRRTEGGFLGDDVVLAQLAHGPPRLRVGIAADGRRPIRDGAALRTPDGAAAGVVTSGSHGPTVDRPVAMGYVDTSLAEVGTELVADVRGKDAPCTVAALPFVEHRYVRSSS